MAVQQQPISGSQLFDFWTVLCKDGTPLSLWTVKLCHGWPNTGGGKKKKEPLGRQMLSSPLKEKKKIQPPSLHQRCCGRGGGETTASL